MLEEESEHQYMIEEKSELQYMLEEEFGTEESLLILAAGGLAQFAGMKGRGLNLLMEVAVHCFVVAPVGWVFGSRMGRRGALV